ncbi:MAG TPA: DUF938 domain-containing protein [Steroidobacteraceae bacterium]|nr:DUF938 domain-containing protein [Steroidobacteraceae bacterium]
MNHCVSEAAERNKAPILRVLSVELAGATSVLEIGSGTGQHALHFAAHLPHLTWQPTDTGDYLSGLRERLAQEPRANLRTPLKLDVRDRPWPSGPFDAVYSANTLHIMSWACVEDFFRGVGEVLGKPGVLCLYGPFRYGGRYTSDSNAAFDEYLRGRDPESGIRDVEALQQLAARQGLRPSADHAMPANNQLLVFRNG